MSGFFSQGYLERASSTGAPQWGWRFPMGWRSAPGRFPLVLTTALFLLITGAARGDGSSPSHAQPVAPLAVPSLVPADPTSGQPPFVLPPLPTELLGEQTGGSYFLLNGVEFMGNTRFTDEELQAVAAPWLGAQVNVARLEALRIALTRHYTEAGYINSGARMPDQKIEGGVVRFQLVEGRLSEIRISGHEGLHPTYIAGRLIRPGEVFSVPRLQERYQQLLADPLIERLNGTLRPGVVPGEALLDLQVSRAQPYALSVEVNNHRPASTGAEQVGLAGTLRNLTGWGDALSFSVWQSRGARALATEFRLPLLQAGTQLFLRAERTDSEVVESPLDTADIYSEFRALALGVEYPLVQSLRRKLLLGVRLNARDSQTFVEGGIPFGFSEGVESDGSASTRVASLYQEWIERGSEAVLAMRSTLNIGLDRWGATVHRDRADGRYLAWIGQFNRVSRLGDGERRLIIAGAVQLASDRLLPQERFAIGGVGSIRGYRENTRVKDNAWSLSIELRQPVSEALWKSDLGKLEWATFVDLGSAWEKGRPGSGRLLSSVGAGLLWQYKALSAELFGACSLRRVDTNGEHNLQDDGLHFRIRLQLL